MSKGWNYSSGDWNLICDVCSTKIKASTAKHRWDGYLVCPSCYENRHPQDFIRAKVDKISVPFSRPRSTDVFTNVTYTIPLSCIPMTSVGEADRGVADCARADIRTMNDLVD